MAAARKLDLDPRTRRILIVIGVTETMLKIIALIDLARHRQDSIRGPKAVWAAAISTISSAGAVPILYFVFGRRRSSQYDQDRGTKGGSGTKA